MKETLVKYGVVFGARYRKDQKKRFRDVIIEEYRAHQWEVEMMDQAQAHHFFTHPNDKIKTLLVIPYDTPTNINRKGDSYYPFSILRQKQMLWRNLKYRMIVSVVGALSMGTFLWFFTQTNAYLRLAGILGLVITLVMLYRQLFDSYDSNNMNLNSASIALVMKLLKIGKAQHYGVLWVDQYYQHTDVEALLAKLNLKQEVEVVLLESLAEGEALMIKEKKTSSLTQFIKHQSMEIREIPSDLTYSILMRGTMMEEEVALAYGMSHEDYRVDVKQLEQLYTVIESYIGE